MVLAALALAGPAAGQAPSGLPLQLDAPAPAAHAGAAEALKSSLPATLSIPVAPLGFVNPSPYYLGHRYSLVSLDFLDEDHLLFTFRVPGLMRREAKEGEAESERQIRALVVAVPSGAVLSEALWTLHDHLRYLWMLPDGHFLLRNGEEVYEGSSTLQLKPLLHFSGPVEWLQPDPSGRYLVAESRETPDAKEAAAKELLTPSDEGFNYKQAVKIRILQTENGQVLLQSRIPTTRLLAINSESYLHSQYRSGLEWSVQQMLFAGGSKEAGSVTSTCAPTLHFLSQQEILASLCDTLGGHKLAALTTGGQHLWENFAPDTAIWSMLIPASNGSRVARESLVLRQPLSVRNGFAAEDIRDQLVEVLNASDGKQALTVQVSPILDGGGNVALSPSGRRVAVLSGGAIRLFDLPAPAPLAGLSGNQIGH